MSLGLAGLISGVMGGAARGYTQVAEGEMRKQQELDLRKQMLEAEEEKQLRIDEIKRNRDRADKDYELSPEHIEKVGAADRMKSEITARNRRDNAPLAAEADAAELDAGATNVKRKATLEGEAAAAGQVAKMNTPGYQSALRQEADAKESSATRAAAAESSFDLSQKKALADLRKQLAEATDPGQRDALEQAISDMSGATTKSYSDMVTAAGHFRMLAQNLRKDAENMAPQDADATLARAQGYEDDAVTLMRQVASKRGVGTSGGGGGLKAGDTTVIKSGPHKGKTAVYDGKGWKLQ